MNVPDNNPRLVPQNHAEATIGRMVNGKGGIENNSCSTANKHQYITIAERTIEIDFSEAVFLLLFIQLNLFKKMF